MSVDQRIESLRAKHSQIEGEINREETRPAPDNILIHDLKKQKLKIKDQLAEYHVN